MRTVARTEDPAPRSVARARSGYHSASHPPGAPEPDRCCPSPPETAERPRRRTLREDHRHPWTWSSPSTRVRRRARRTSGCAARASCPASSMAGRGLDQRAGRRQDLRDPVPRGRPHLGREAPPPRRQGHDHRVHQERPAPPAQRPGHPCRLPPRQPQASRWRSTCRSSSPARRPRSRRPAARCSTTCRASTSRRCRTTSRTRSASTSPAWTRLDAAIHVSDLDVDPEKVQILTDGETLVATVVPPRVEVEEEPVLAEGEEGEGAEEGAEEGEGAAASESGEGEGPSESGGGSEG